MAQRLKYLLEYNTKNVPQKIVFHINSPYSFGEPIILQLLLTSHILRNNDTDQCLWLPVWAVRENTLGWRQSL